MAQNLCGYTEETITEALALIRKICNHNSCEECPFSNTSGTCLIKEEMPVDWTTTNNSPWKALK